MTDFVLIHGAYQGGWIWKFVSERLRAEGHNVLAPTLDGCAERAEGLREGITTETHGAEIANLLYFQDLKNVVLVAPYFGENMLHCIRCFAELDVKLGLVTHESEDRVPDELRSSLAGHYRISNSGDPDQLAAAARAYQKE